MLDNIQMHMLTEVADLHGVPAVSYTHLRAHET